MPNNSDDFNPNDLLSIKDHNRDLNDIHTRLDRIEGITESFNEKVSEVISEHVSTQTKVKQIAKDQIEKDSPTRDLIKDISKDVYKEQWQSKYFMWFIGGAGLIGAVISWFVQALINNSIS